MWMTIFIQRLVLLGTYKKSLLALEKKQHFHSQQIVYYYHCQHNCLYHDDHHKDPMCTSDRRTGG